MHREAAETLAETIVAPATAAGRSAVAVVRLSGPGALAAAARRLGGDGWRERRPRVAEFVGSDGAVLDCVLATWFPAPASYTGEEVVEISCHGSPVVVREIVGALVEEGVRLARPGEFTERAFVNGKMDLSQAEAVRDLIESETAFQARLAARQLEGALARELQPCRQKLIRAVSHFETALEFAEDETEPDPPERLLGSLREVDAELARLEESFRLGAVVRGGVDVAVMGRPNAGKSSLFNALLGRGRAIVTEQPGTTRDALAEVLDLGGVAARLIDTAGIRESQDLVERLGVEKSIEFLRRADLALFVVDGSREYGREDEQASRLLQGCRRLLVINKMDLEARVQVPEEAARGCLRRVEVSALTGKGVESLRRAMLEAVAGGDPAERESALITNLRHQRCLIGARRRLASALEALEAGLSEEFPIYDLRGCLDSLGEIIGETTSEDILREIFSTFCIGK